MNSTTAAEINERSVRYFEVAPGVWGMKDIFVNFYMVSNTQNNTWVLIDAGLKTSAKKNGCPPVWRRCNTNGYYFNACSL